MYQKILTKPRKWDEKSLALATKEELTADLLLRKTKMQQRKRTRFPWEARAIQREIYWMDILHQELAQRKQWVVEEA